MAKEAYNKLGFRPLHPTKARVGYYPVATTQTLAVGDPVILSSGQIAVAVENSSSELVGVIAQPAASLTAATLVAVWDDPDELFVARVSADASSVQVGTQCDLDGTTGAFLVDIANSTQDLFCFMGCLPGEDNTQTGAYCKVRISKHALADISS